MKKGVKIITVLVVLLLVFGAMFSSCKKKEEEKKVFVAAMATDTGGLGDKSFNDGSFGGLQLAKDKYGSEAIVVESKEQTDYIPNLSGLADDGADIVFAVGFMMADAMVEAAENYPDTYFAGIDIGLSDDAPDNAMGILFKEQESGYLAGVLAGLLTKEYASSSDKFNDDNVVGMILGLDIPPVERYQAGFYAGVKSVNPDCEVLSIVTGSFTDLAKGKESGIALIDQGADIIFQVAGLTGVGAITACKEAGLAAIGVDVDQWEVAPDTVITSAEKRLTHTAFLAIESVMDGTFKGGNRTFGINDDATGLSPYHNFDSIIPQAVKDAVAKATADIKAGKITIPASRAEAGYEG